MHGPLPVLHSFPRSSRGTPAGFVLAVFLLPVLGSVATAQTERISVSSAGVQVSGSSLHESAITPDGRHVAFQSEATDLVAGDTNALRDIFVRDRLTGLTSRVSVSTAGVESNGQSFRPTLSADGRWVAFESDGTNLVANDTNGATDVFLHDHLTGVTTRRSVSSGGVEGNGPSNSPFLSADGQWLAFASQATTFDPLANNTVAHVFLHQVATGLTVLVATSFTGLLENGSSGGPSLSADGRYIAFHSGSSNLLALPTSGSTNVYVRDRVAGMTFPVSASATGGDGNGASQDARISANGRVVAFQSSSSNLIAGDTNFLTDVFVRDLDLGMTERVNLTTTGSQSAGGSDAIGQPPAVSSDGRYVAFVSWATDLIPGTLGFQAIYLRDRELGQTSFVSLSTTNAQANGISFHPSMSSDGRFVVFQSLADNLVPADTNAVYDLFVRGPLPTTWTDLGGGVAGVSGVPTLLGSGTLVAGSAGNLVLNSARPFARVRLFVSMSSTPFPFRCGTIVPVPWIMSVPGFADVNGNFTLPWTSFPTGLSGQSLYFQYLALDPASACNVAFSNSLRGDVP